MTKIKDILPVVDNACAWYQGNRKLLEALGDIDTDNIQTVIGIIRGFKK